MWVNLKVKPHNSVKYSYMHNFQVLKPDQRQFFINV